MRQCLALSPPAGSASNPIPLLLLLAGVWLSAPAVASTPAPQPAPPPASGALPALVSVVDLNRYAGLWYEIARIPNRFQRQCARDSLAVYTLRSDGSIAVLNQCVKGNGAVDQARGVARVVDPLSQARLKVSLVSVLGWRPFWGDYWIIGLDPDYRWAVVGEPRRRFGWILSRTPSLDPTSWTAIQAILERNGYDKRAFRLGLHRPGLVGGGGGAVLGGDQGAGRRPAAVRAVAPSFARRLSFRRPKAASPRIGLILRPNKS